MKRSEQPVQHTPSKTFTPTTGLYREVAALPVSRSAPAPLQEAKTFL